VNKRSQPSSLPLGVSGVELQARREQRLQTVALLRSGRTPLQIVAIADEAVRVADEAITEVRKQQPPRSASACEEGCAWCCHKTVGTAAPEVLHIAAHLRETLTPEEMQTTRARVQGLVEQRQALRPDRRSRSGLPCALLVDHRCSVYALRPMTCRGYNSSDARACERSLQPGNRGVVPLYAPQQRVCTFVLDGMRAGAAESGLDGELLELTAALHVALTEPDADQRWLVGENLFAPARLP
jgi:hypothetical protein